jgi:hypothetical protein
MRVGGVWAEVPAGATRGPPLGPDHIVRRQEYRGRVGLGIWQGIHGPWLSVSVAPPLSVPLPSTAFTRALQLDTYADPSHV